MVLSPHHVPGTGPSAGGAKKTRLWPLSQGVHMQGGHWRTGRVLLGSSQSEQTEVTLTELCAGSGGSMAAVLAWL